MKYKSLRDGWIPSTDAIKKLGITAVTMVAYKKKWPECFDEINAKLFMVKIEELNSHVKKY